MEKSVTYMFINVTQLESCFRKICYTIIQRLLVFLTCTFLHEKVLLLEPLSCDRCYTMCCDSRVIQFVPIPPPHDQFRLINMINSKLDHVGEYIFSCMISYASMSVKGLSVLNLLRDLILLFFIFDKCQHCSFQCTES